MPRTTTSKSSVDKKIASAVKSAVAKVKKSGALVVKKRKSRSEKSANMYGSKGHNIRQLGSDLGEYLGGMASKIIGFGDYKFQRNSLVGKLHGDTAEVPFMHSTKDGVRVRHREFIQDLSGSVAFADQTFSMNPGLSSAFPWLSSIAQNFEEYNFNGLIFEFKSTSSEALTSTNTALGTVILAAEYNTTNPAYINKQQMENSMWAASTKPACSLIMPVECSPALNPLNNMYIRTGAVPSGQDIRMYDLCNVQVGTVGMQAAAVIGELWVSYDVVFLKPQLDSGLALAAKTAHYQLTAPVVTTAYFGTARTAKYDSIGLSVSGTAITFPIGTNGIYNVQYTVGGDSTALTQPTQTLVNCTAAPAWINGDTGTGISNNGSTAIRFQSSYLYTISDPGLIASITYSAGTLPANPTNGDLLVQQLNGNLNS